LKNPGLPLIIELLIKIWLINYTFIVKLYKIKADEMGNEKIMVMADRGAIDENGKGL